MRVFAVLWVALALSAPQAHAQPFTATVDVCCTPAERCTGKIVSAIAGASQQIRIQAYGFTSAPILLAVIAAKQRGIDVQVILDKSDKVTNARGRSAASILAEAAIPVWIDSAPGIAHNKVFVIDGHEVIGGSLNFTKAAETRNAENMTLTESRELVARCLTNWGSRRDCGDMCP